MSNINPKAVLGRQKTKFSNIPPSFLKIMMSNSLPANMIVDIAKAMDEGARKYGRYNWRKDKIQLSDYFDAATRHWMDWSNGDIIDKDSSLNHLIKIVAGLAVVYDAMYAEFFEDDRVDMLSKSESVDSPYDLFVNWFYCPSEKISLKEVILSFIDKARSFYLGDVIINPTGLVSEGCEDINRTELGNGKTVTEEDPFVATGDPRPSKEDIVKSIKDKIATKASPLQDGGI